MNLESVIPRAVGITANSPLAAALNERQTILDLSERSHHAVLSPQQPGGLSPALRAALAARVTTINDDAALTAHYAALLTATPAPPPQIAAIADPAQTPPAEVDPWLSAIVAHADRLTTEPQLAGKAEIEALQSAGVDDADIVRLTQLVGFVNYQLRVAVGLRLLSATPGS